MSHDEGEICLCSVNHQPYPLELHKHHIQPKALGGADVASNLVYLCPTTHANTHEIMRHFFRLGTVLTFTQIGALYDVPVSRYAYNLAKTGYLLVLEGTITS